MATSTGSVDGTTHKKDAESSEAAKNRLLDLEFYQPGMWVDARDTTGKWCQAKCLNLQQNKALVHYDGWNSRWDEWHEIGGPKIFPFRTQTKGYTGQQKIALRDWAFDMQELNQFDTDLRQVLACKFQKLGAKRITQFLRGDLPVFVDNLLCFNYVDEDAHVSKVNKFLQLVLEVIVQWFHQVEPLVEFAGRDDVIRALDDENVALCLCVHEFNESLLRIFDADKRCRRFYAQYGRFDNPKTADGPFARVPLNYARNLVSRYLLDNINTFGQLGGFQRLLDLLKLGLNQDKKYRSPLDWIILFIRDVCAVAEYFPQSFADSFVPTFRETVFDRIIGMSDEELKFVDRDAVQSVLDEMHPLLVVAYKGTATDELVENLELTMALRFLQSSFLEKRLKGVTEIKEMVERVEKREFRGYSYGSSTYSSWTGYSSTNSYHGKPATKWLTSDLLVEWIRRHDLLDLLLGTTTHTEIIKRCPDILKFLAKEKALTTHDLELVWSCCQGKHEAVVRVVYDAIVDLSSQLSGEQLEFLFQKMSSIPLSEYDEKLMFMMKDFSSNAITQTYPNSRLSTFDPSTVNWYCVDAFWTAIQDSSPLDNNLVEVAVKCLTDLLKLPVCKPLRDTYLEKCISNLQQGVSVPQSLQLAMNILDMFNEHSAVWKPVTPETAISALSAKFDLIQLILQDVSRYHSVVRHKITQPDFDKTLSLFSQTFVGRYSHKEQISVRLDFLEYLLQHSKLELTPSLLNILWDISVNNANSSEEADNFFVWLKKAQEPSSGKHKTVAFTDDMTKQLLLDVLCSDQRMHFAGMGFEAFSCFLSYFQHVNETEEKLEVQAQGRRVRVLKWDLHGFETLWEITLKSRDQHVVDTAVAFLTDLHLKLGLQLARQRKVIWEKFVDKCMGIMTDSLKQIQATRPVTDSAPVQASAPVSSAEQSIARCLELLKTFLDRCEGKTSNRLEETSYGYGGSSVNVTVVLKPEGTSRTCQLGTWQQIGLLRKRVSALFSIPINELQLTHRAAVLEPDEDDRTIKDVGLYNIVYATRTTGRGDVEDELSHARFILSNNQQYLDLLFELLSMQSSTVAPSVWDLLTRLPTNTKTKETLYTLTPNSKGHVDWDQLLDPVSVHKLLYCLQIVEELSLQEGKKDEWCDRFIALGGAVHIYSILMATNMDDILLNPLTKMCVGILMKLLRLFIETNRWRIAPADTAAVIDKILHAILKTAESTLQTNDSSSLKMVKKTQDGDKKEADTDNSRLVSNGFHLLLTSLRSQPQCVSSVYKFPHIRVLVENALLRSTDARVREKFASGLFQLCKDQPDRLEHVPAWHSLPREDMPYFFLLPLLLEDILPIAFEFPTTCTFFFLLTSKIVSDLSPEGLSSITNRISSYQLISTLVEDLRTRNVSEHTQVDVDYITRGTLVLLRAVLARCPEHKRTIGRQSQGGLVHLVLHQCLFEHPTAVCKGKNAPPKCKSRESRKLAFELLLELCRHCDENLSEVLEYLLPFHTSSYWRGNKIADWTISPMAQEKSYTGYVGLKNLGCICYMNSLLQQFYMCPEFRNGILAAPLPAEASETAMKEHNGDDDSDNQSESQTSELEENVLYQLQTMFGALRESEKQYYNPRGFCQSFKDWEGNPVNVLEQMDVDEFFNMFMDRLETLLKGSPQQNLVKDYFGGVLSNELICKGCPHYSEREEPFLAVSLQVKNKKSILESLESFVEGEMLEGDNAYMCETCQKKVNTLRRVCIKKLPNTLILVLKRFEFDFDSMVKVKVNDRCEFPFNLNMEPYTQQGLAKKAKDDKPKEPEAQETGNNAESSHRTKDTEGETDESKTEPAKEFPADYFEYQLKGIVIHLGTADSGHYYSLIKEASESGDQWVEFNDTVVRPFDADLIPSEAFGGEEKWNYGGANASYGPVSSSSGASNSTWLREKCRNAYLLFYERVAPYTADGEPIPDVKSQREVDQAEAVNASMAELKLSEPKQEQEEAAESSQLVPTATSVDIPAPISQSVWEENTRYWRSRNVFNPEYFDFVMQLVNQHEIPANQEYESLSQTDLTAQVIKFATRFVLTTLVRAKDKDTLPEWLEFLKQIYERYLPACVWLVESMYGGDLAREILLECPRKETRKAIVGFLSHIMRVLYPFEESDFPTAYVPDGVPQTSEASLVKFGDSLLYLLQDSNHYWKHFGQFFQVFSIFAELGPRARQYMYARRTFGRLIVNYLGQHAPVTDLSDMSDVPLPRLMRQPSLDRAPKLTRQSSDSDDEFIIKKKDKDMSSPEYIYQWRTLSVLARASASLSPADQRYSQINSKLLLDGGHLSLTNQELDLLFSTEFLARLCNEGTTRAASRFIGDLCVHLCTDNYNTTALLMHQCLVCFREGDFDEFKPSLRLFTRLLNIDDSLRERRTEEGMKSILAIINDCSNFYKATEASIDYLFKLCRKNEYVFKWMVTHKADWKWLDAWLRENPSPPMGYATMSKVRLYKRNRTTSISNTTTSSSSSSSTSSSWSSWGYKAAPTSERLNLLRKLAKGELPDPVAWDSDEDMSLRQYAVEQKYDILDSLGKWLPGTIKRVTEGQLYIHYDGYKTQFDEWVEIDNDRVAPLGCYSKTS
eukprot:GILJ01005210.1.p1 GENE.GILJ01005210.1~~GILJ01005210.1.p1  ORF type:complete len:2590 (-),score=405.82 GILJ01005210.1:174-7943(-)